jgi:integrase
MTFAAFLPQWLERAQRTRKGLRPSTVENYARYIRQDIIPSQLGATRLEDIRKHHLNGFIDDLVAAGRGAVTVRRIAAVVQGALRAAADGQLIPANPATRLALPHVDERPFQPWQPEEVGRFLDLAAQHRLGAFFEVAVFTGLRRSELAGLRWADVDLARGTLTVRASKTGAGLRVLDIDDRTVGALLAWRLAQEAERDAWGPAWASTGHVFTYEDGRPLKPQYLTRLFDKLRVQAGLPEMTLHGLRHMHASLMIASGTDLAIVSKRLGHSSQSITADIYAHLVGSASRDAANRAAALVPSRRVLEDPGAHTLHAQAAQEREEAVSP